MPTYSRQFLSGSTNGTPIAVTSTNSAGAAVVHTASTNKDEVWLYGYNKSTVAGQLYVELGDTVSPVIVTIPAQTGPQVVVPGWMLTNAKVVSAYCSTVSTSALYVGGYVNRATTT